MSRSHPRAKVSGRILLLPCSPPPAIFIPSCFQKVFGSKGFSFWYFCTKQLYPKTTKSLGRNVRPEDLPGQCSEHPRNHNIGAHSTRLQRIVNNLYFCNI